MCRPGGHVIISEGLAVQNRPLQRMIFSIASSLERFGISVDRIHLEKGEVLAFLTPSDLSRLSSTVLGGSSLVQFTKEFRHGTEFSGVVQKFWQWQTCRITAILQRT